jgi:hypothetical protein
MQADMHFTAASAFQTGKKAYLNFWRSLAACPAQTLSSVAQTARVLGAELPTGLAITKPRTVDAPERSTVGNRYLASCASQYWAEAEYLQNRRTMGARARGRAPK